jgi:hypothetical protein
MRASTPIPSTDRQNRGIEGQLDAAPQALIPPPVSARAVSSAARTFLIEAFPYIYWLLPFGVEGLHFMPSQGEALTQHVVAGFLLLATFPACSLTCCQSTPFPV